MRTARSSVWKIQPSMGITFPSLQQHKGREGKHGIVLLLLFFTFYVFTKVANSGLLCAINHSLILNKPQIWEYKHMWELKSQLHHYTSSGSEISVFISVFSDTQELVVSNHGFIDNLKGCGMHLMSPWGTVAILLSLLCSPITTNDSNYSDRHLPVSLCPSGPKGPFSHFQPIRTQLSHVQFKLQHPWEVSQHPIVHQIDMFFYFFVLPRVPVT